MNLSDIYARTDIILSGLDFNALSEGFHKYKFAIYNSREICLNGTIIPYEDAFRGNTSIFYNGEYIAIWNIEFSPVDDMDTLAYLMVHEMFHCHQERNGETRYPSDLSLLNYPGDLDHFTKKYHENLCLADAYEHGDLDQLKRFAALRRQRMLVYPDMVNLELKAETIEGMAEYIGLKALKRINGDKFTSIVKKYLKELRAESDLLFDVRRISYYTGVMFLLSLDVLGHKIQNNFDSELTIYEQNPIAADGITAEAYPCEFIRIKYDTLVREKKAKIEAHIAHSRYVKCDAFICGYDPMNMFRVGNMIYCSYFVCLNENGQTKSINNAVLLVLADDSDQTITGYYIPSDPTTLAHPAQIDNPVKTEAV